MEKYKDSDVELMSILLKLQEQQRQVIRDEIGALEEELAKCEDEDEAASEK